MPAFFTFPQWQRLASGIMFLLLPGRELFQHTDPRINLAISVVDRNR